MRFLTFLLLVLFFGLSSCEDLSKDEVFEINTINDLESSVWTPSEYTDSLIVCKRLDKLPNSIYAFQFNIDGKFIEHKNAGWCGTPPITYALYEGTWSVSSDSILSIEVPYWGGIAQLKRKIVSVDKNKLVYYTLEENYEPIKH